MSAQNANILQSFVHSCIPSVNNQFSSIDCYFSIVLFFICFIPLCPYFHFIFFLSLHYLRFFAYFDPVFNLPHFSSLVCLLVCWLSCSVFILLPFCLTTCLVSVYLCCLFFFSSSILPLFFPLLSCVLFPMHNIPCFHG